MNPQIFRLILLLLLFPACCLSLASQGGKVALQSGELYELRSILHLQGCVVPASADAQALMHTTEVAQKTGKWRITRMEDGCYTIRHAETGRYMTYDGVRTTHRRYMRLTETDHGADSRWRIYPGKTHVIVASASSRQQNHLLNVRRDSRIVGLYRNNTSNATDNERFVLIDRKGRAVNEIDGKAVIHLLPVDPQSGQVAMDKAVSPVRVEQGGLSFCVDGRKPVYDKLTQTFLYALPEKYMGKALSLRITLSDGTAEHCSVDGVPTNAKHRATFDLSTPKRVYTISANKANVVYTARLSFTYLPIIELNAHNVSRHDFVDAALVMHDADVPNDSTYRAKVRWRGEYTASFGKRSMGVKLVGEDGKKINRSLGGLRTDNYWILDAMTVDPARMRGRVAMDLWNDFAERPQADRSHSKACYGSRGRLVEVFLNGQYHGVYNLCERIDRKQLQLPKPQNGQVRGCLWKADSWSAWTLMGLQSGRREVVGHTPPPFDNRNETWCGWDAKYPEVGKNNTDWSALHEAIKLVAATDRKEFAAQVSHHFDLPVVRDYYLFLELLLATDNSGKNTYWAVCDQTQSVCLFPIPWDLDGTLGQGWNGQRGGCAAEQNYRQFLFAHQHQSGLFERLYKEDPDRWNVSMAERYRALRRSHFEPKALAQRLTHYLRLMENSGAIEREQRRWGADRDLRVRIVAEVDYIQRWLEQRIAYLDRQYGVR